MTELFPDIPEYLRKITDFWIAQAKIEENPVKAIKMIKACHDAMPTDEAKEYFDFAVQCQLLTKPDK